MEPVKGRCNICRTQGFVRHHSLYVTGSEGIYLCEDCTIILTNLVRGMIRAAAKSHLEGFRKAKFAE